MGHPKNMKSKTRPCVEGGPTADSRDRHQRKQQKVMKCRSLCSQWRFKPFGIPEAKRVAYLAGFARAGHPRVFTASLNKTMSSLTTPCHAKQKQFLIQRMSHRPCPFEKQAQKRGQSEKRENQSRFCVLRAVHLSVSHLTPSIKVYHETAKRGSLCITRIHKLSSMR